MKRIIMALAVIIAATSCIRSRQIKEAGLRTDAFLEAYCSADYETAASICTEPLKSQILTTAGITERMDSSVTAMTDTLMKQTVWEKSVVETADTDTEDITFTCSTTFMDRNISYTVTLTPVERVWFISDIN